MAPPSKKQPVIALIGPSYRVFLLLVSGRLPILPKKNQNLILQVNIG